MPEIRHGLLAAAVFSGVVVAGLLAQFTGLPREAVLMSGIFTLAAFLWMTEAVPLYATSLMVIGLEILLLANPGGWSGLGFERGPSPRLPDILAAAADPVLLLFFGGFLLARSATKTGVDRTMASWLLKPFGGKPGLLLLGVLCVTAFFSMWMSNTATAALMLALTAPVLLQVPATDPFRRALALAVAFGANIGGIATPIGSPPNALAVGVLEKQGLSISFLQWMLITVPLAIFLLALCWALLWWFHRPQSTGWKIEFGAPKLGRAGLWVVSTFVLTALLWMTDQIHGLPASLVALFPVLLLTIAGILNRTDVNSLEWNILILIAGGIALGAGMQMTGLDQMVAGLVLRNGAAGGLLVLSAVVLTTLVLGTFMSNTAAANLLLPVGISLAPVLGAGTGSILQMALAVALAASMSMALPISTPPNAIAYSAGAFSTRDMVRTGVLVGIVGSAIIIIGLRPVLRFWGLIP